MSTASVVPGLATDACFLFACAWVKYVSFLSFMMLQSFTSQILFVERFVIKTLYSVEFPVILADCGPGGFQHPIALLIHIPKGFSSKMTLEVAPRGLDIATVKV